MRIAVNGAAGRMGQSIIANLSTHMQLAGAYVKPENSYYQSPVSTHQIVYSSRPDHADDIDVVIDFSSVDSSLAIAKWCAQQHIPLIVGTTGFSEEEFSQLKTFSSTIPLLWAANTSLGISLLQTALPIFTKALTNADIEILEAHHKHKRDAPSGTALKLGQVIEDTLKSIGKASHAQYGRHSQNDGARQPQEIGYHAIRGGDIIGDHTVLFALEGERIEVSHKVTHRDTFAKGALQAANWLSQQNIAGFYSMQDIFDF